jgi:uncharacterized membrane protein YoaK (UPF0700 family)
MGCLASTTLETVRIGMAVSTSGTSWVRSTLLALLALVFGVAAWGIPARWRWVHPSTLSAAGAGTPSLIQVSDAAAQAGRPGPAALLATAAVQLGHGGTNELLARLESVVAANPALRTTGGVDPLLGRVAGLRVDPGTNIFAPALDIFLPEANRGLLRTFLAQSQAPSTRSVLAAREFAPREFAPVGRPGGQPLEAVLLMISALLESEVLTPEWSAELQRTAAASVAGTPNDTLERICLDVLVLSRRLDWTSLRELARTVPNTRALTNWVGVVRTNTTELPLLYAGATLSGGPGAIAERWSAASGTGAVGLRTALNGGVGAVRAFAATTRPVCKDGFAFRPLAGWVHGAPEVAAAARTALLGLAALFMSMALGGVLDIGASGDRAAAWAGTLGMGLALGFLLFIIAEPAVPRPPKEPRLRVQLLSGPTAPAGTSISRERPVMETTTIATIVLFALLQVTIYVICRRKITEILEMPEPAAVRLRLMENEENLFDAGLYIGIAGTAAALVLQVLHVVEANLLAAYSSNLLGIVTVALIKIRHVRPIKRELILEGQAEAAAAPQR